MEENDHFLYFESTAHNTVNCATAVLFYFIFVANHDYAKNKITIHTSILICFIESRSLSVAVAGDLFTVSKSMVMANGTAI